MTAGRFGGLLLKFPNIISKTWTKSNNNGGKPSSWRRWITWSSPWTISWLLASWAAAPESTGYRTAPCPPFPGPQHSQSQSSCWQSAAPAGSRWTGPDPVCFGSKHHGNCTGSWEEEGEGRIRVNLAFFFISQTSPEYCSRYRAESSFLSIQVSAAFMKTPTSYYHSRYLGVRTCTLPN